MPIEKHLRPRNVLRGFTIAAALLAAPAFAQDDASAAKLGAAKPGRAWTDPPVHGSAVPVDEPARVAPAKIGQPAETLAAAPKRASRPARQALEARPPARTAARPVRTKLATPQRRLRAVASSPPPAASRSRGARMATLRPVPAEAYAPPPPYYGRVVVMRPDPGFPSGFEDDRARRMRLARDAGYVLIRSRTYLLPDGRRLQSVRPEDADD